MAIRLSGLVSGMDTDAMVKELVSAYSTQKEDYVKDQTKLEWKMDAWKTLNTKIYSLYSNSLSNLRFQKNYNLKSVSISDTSVATVSASISAVNGTHELAVTKVAKTGYLTGGVISQSNGSKIVGDTKLSSIIGNGDYSFVANSGGDEATVSFTGDTTVDQLVSKLKTAGLKASFDTVNQRFFVSAADSGLDEDFSLTAGTTASMTALSTLGLLSNTGTDSDVYAALVPYDGFTYHGSNADAAKQTLFDQLIDSGIATYNSDLKDKVTEAYNDLYTAYSGKTITYTKVANDAAATETNKRDAYLAKMVEDLGKYTTDAGDTTKTLITKTYSDIDGSAYDVDSSSYTEADKATLVANQQGILGSYDTSIANITKDISNLEQRIKDFGTNKYATYTDAEKQAVYGDFWNVTDLQTLKDQQAYSKLALNKFSIQKADYATKYDENTENIVTNDYYNRIDAAVTYSSAAKTALKIDGQDSSIILNGATFTSNTNNYSINGITITANGESAKNSVTNEYITSKITVNTDVNGIYKMIKGFFTQYNTLINEMDTKYNASSAKGYEPLTDDEKEAMSDTEVEKWETKIKDALLRRDNTLSSVSSAMETELLKTYEIDGQTYGLSTFGIRTLGYFVAADNEKNAYHIDGDSEDASVSGNEDKLKAAIASNPDAVISYFTQMASSLYSTLSSKMQSTTLRSAYKVYNDKEMQEQYDDYTDLIDKWEDKVSEMEDYYYKKFSAMESAMSKLNSQQSSLASLLG